MVNKGQGDFRSEISAVDLTASQPTLDHYDSGSQSSGKDTVDATMSSSWLAKLKDDSGEDEHGNLHSSKDLSLFPNPPYPQCSSAPTLTASNASSYTQSSRNSVVNSMLSGRKDKRRPGGLLPLPSQALNRLTELEYSPKRLSELPSSTGCPSKNWKITHSDRLNALIDECERIVDGRKVFKCKFCGKMYDIKSSMRYHMKIIHLQLHLRTSEMQCRICGKQFTCISAVNRHQLKCSANSSSTFTSTNPIQSSCSSSFLGKPRQTSIPAFTNQSPSAFMHLNSAPGLRWSGTSGGGRHSNQSISNQLPFTFTSASDTGAYMSTSVSTAFPSQPGRSGFELDGGRFTSGSSEISPHQLANASLAHSVHHLVEGIPPLSFNEVFLASLGRSNGSTAGERKAPVFEDLSASNYMGIAAAAAHNFLTPSPSKRIRKLEGSSNFIEGRIGDNMYERLFPSQNEVAITAGTPNTASSAAIDLSLNASC
ncbi:unnamed protein product [Rodentolepis nana]|uniref:C2H2-type domain-containing protein n=1 Tax=Rodentolepis nana TaxID=102285 RepID=A0A0R3TXB9_RODNA|nr:unnamed protein product [Rodentolepis nana]